VEAESFEVWDFGELLAEVFEASIAEAEWITAAEDDFADGGIAGDGLQSGGPVIGSAWIFGVGVIAAEAVAAVDSAGRSGHEESSAVVFLKQSRAAACVEVADGIGGEAGVGEEFAGEREYLEEEWVSGVTGLHALEEVFGHEHGEAGIRGGAGFGGGGEVEPLQEFVCGADSLREFALPGFRGHGEGIGVEEVDQRPSSLTRKASSSEASSMILAVGFPAP
jgi:hypothetical protein